VDLHEFVNMCEVAGSALVCSVDVHEVMAACGYA
jgi:hypothetical protein